MPCHLGAPAKALDAGIGWEEVLVEGQEVVEPVWIDGIYKHGFVSEVLWDPVKELTSYRVDFPDVEKGTESTGQLIRLRSKEYVIEWMDGHPQMVSHLESMCRFLASQCFFLFVFPQPGSYRGNMVSFD